MGRQHTCKLLPCLITQSDTQKGRHDKYIPPKKAYSFEAMLDDLLDFAAVMLVDGGRLSFWMPTANDEDMALGIPNHPCLEIISICVQTFNKCAPFPELMKRES